MKEIDRENKNQDDRNRFKSKFISHKHRIPHHPRQKVEVK